jgi:uncharacterized Zn finger protein
MNQKFYIQGTNRFYEIYAEKVNKKIKLKCSCPASNFKTLCKHIVALISKDTSSYREDTTIKSVDAFFDEEFFNTYNAIASEVAEIEKELQKKIKELKDKVKPIKQKLQANLLL